MATIFTYNLNIPLASNLPSADQPNMETNTNSINNLINVDHITFGAATGAQSDGYHTVIHMSTFNPVPNPNPIPVPTIGELYVKSLTIGNTDTCLFFQSANGRITQLSGILGAGNQTQAATNGFTPLTGGIILQWGLQAGISGSTNNISFPINFPTNNFNVQVTLRSSTGGIPLLLTTLIDNTKFNVALAGAATASVFWLAIGN